MRDSDGQIIAEKETLFDVVDNWWKVMRLAVRNGSTVASPGAPSSIPRLSDAAIQNRVEKMRHWGFNTFEPFHYAPPWDLDPEGDMWEDLDYAGHFISRDRVAQWGSTLHSQGMKYLGYNDIGAIQGPPEWQLRWKSDGTVWRKYYADQGYFHPNLNFLSQRWADENIAAINAFDFDGIFIDSAYAIGRNTVRYYNDNDGNPIPQSPSVGQYMHDGLGPAKPTVRATKEFVCLCEPECIPACLLLPSTFHSTMFMTRSFLKQISRMYGLTMTMSICGRLNGTRANIPAASYPQEYERMAVIMTSLVDVLGKPVLQWAFLTSGNK